MKDNAERLERLQVFLEGTPRQAVLRNGAADHAAGALMLFEDLHVTAGCRELPGCRHSSGSGSDNGYPGCAGVRTALNRRCGKICDVALHVPNRNGLVEVVAHAGLLAEVIANAAQHARQRVVFSHDLDRLGIVSLSHGAHVLRHLLTYRALVNAGRFDAIEVTELPRRLGVRRVETRLPVHRVLHDTKGVIVER